MIIYLVHYAFYNKSKNKFKNSYEKIKLNIQNTKFYKAATLTEILQFMNFHNQFRIFSTGSILQEKKQITIYSSMCSLKELYLSLHHTFITLTL